MFNALYLLALGFGSVFTIASIFAGFSSGSGTLELEHDTDVGDNLGEGSVHDAGVSDFGDGLDLSDNIELFEPSEIDPATLPEVVRHNLSVAGKSIRQVPRYRPFRQFRFYTAWAQFFGLAGFLLSLVKVAELPTFLLALALGFFAGFIVTYALYAVDRYGGAKMTTLNDMIGRTGHLTLPVAPGKVGSVQLTLESGVKDLICKTHEEGTLGVGEEVIIYATDDEYIYVAPVSLMERDDAIATLSGRVE